MSIIQPYNQGVIRILKAYYHWEMNSKKNKKQTWKTNN